MSASADAPRYVIGLTGGVASGKTSASDEFARLGAYVVDTDVVSRALTAPGGGAAAAVAAEFPQCMRDGVLDRSALRKLVFADGTARKRLEALLHPLIRDQTSRLIASPSANQAAYVLLVVPLLFESSAYASITLANITVDVPPSVQLERLRTLRGIDENTARGILGAQMNRDDRLAHTQFVLRNDGSVDRLLQRVRVLHSVLCANVRAFAATYSHAGEIA